MRVDLNYRVSWMRPERLLIFLRFKVSPETRRIVLFQMAINGEGPSKATVCRWYNEFKRGRLTWDEERIAKEERRNVLAVKKLIQYIRRVT